MNKKEQKTMFILDVVELILSIIAIVIFTLIFRLETHNIRYLFLIGDFYVVYSFSKTISSVEKQIEEKRIKTVENTKNIKSIDELSI